MKTGVVVKVYAKFFIVSLVFHLLTACGNSDKTEPRIRVDYISKGEKSRYILEIDELSRKRDPYPWEEGVVGGLPKITKEFFRCKGSGMNPAFTETSESGKVVTYKDCSGVSSHGLPLIHGKEGVYSILIDLLNYIQCRTGKQVVVTSGHRCPQHNKYCDRSKSANSSKHMIGAEADFYVRGMEYDPVAIVDLIMQYYSAKKFSDKEEYTVFHRYEKNDTNVSTKPWYNKEIFVKLFQADEGRNFDNRHPYPYISVQVRYDEKNKERIFYNLNAREDYLRF